MTGGEADTCACFTADMILFLPLPCAGSVGSVLHHISDFNIQSSLQGIAMYVCVCYFNWEAEAKRALQSASEGTALLIPLDATDASKLMPPLLSRPSYTRVTPITPPDALLQGEQECLLPVVAEADA